METSITSYINIYKWRRKTMHKSIYKQLSNYFLVILGTFLLAFGSVIFLTECELVAGGISGIAIIIQHFVDLQIYDYLVAALTVLFWLIGLIFVGKDFALKTALSSVTYIGFTFLLKRVNFFTLIRWCFCRCWSRSYFLRRRIHWRS